MESPDREVPQYFNIEVSLVWRVQIERFHCILIQRFPQYRESRQRGSTLAKIVNQEGENGTYLNFSLHVQEDWTVLSLHTTRSEWMGGVSVRGSSNGLCTTMVAIFSSAKANPCFAYIKNEGLVVFLTRFLYNGEVNGFSLHDGAEKELPINCLSVRYSMCHILSSCCLLRLLSDFLEVDDSEIPLDVAILPGHLKDVLLDAE